MAILLQGLLTSLAAGTGLVFNGYILVVLLWYRRIQTANNLLLLHLALVDTVFCMVVIVGNASWGISITGNATVTDFADIPNRDYSPPASSCQVHGYAWTALPVIIMYNVCGLSFDRYAAISTPLHYSRLINTRRASAFLVLVWILGFTLAIPPLLNVCTYGFYHASLSCVANCTRGSHSDIGYAYAYVSLAVVLPLVIVLICNLRILTIARYHRHRIVSAIYQVTLSAQATVTHQHNPFYLSKFKGKNAIFTIFQLVGSLLTLAAPYFGIVVWEASTGTNADPLYVTVTSILFTWTPPVNAYVYGVKSRVLRQTFKTLLQRHLNKREAIRAVESRASLNPGNSKRTFSRRGSAPAGYFGWENAISNFSRGSPFTASLKAPGDLPYKRTKAFYRRPSFMVDVGSPAGVFQEVVFKPDDDISNLNECDSPKSGLWMTSRGGNASESSLTGDIELPEIVIAVPRVADMHELLSRRIGISQSEPSSPDINYQKTGASILSGSPQIARIQRREPGGPQNRILQRRKTIYSLLPVRNQLPEIKEVNDDAESAEPAKFQSVSDVNLNDSFLVNKDEGSFVCKLLENGIKINK